MREPTSSAACARGEGLVLGSPGVYHYATAHDHGVSGHYGYGAQVMALCERTSGIAYREDTLRNMFPDDRLCKFCERAAACPGPSALPRVAALFVQTDGIYYGLADVDPWDEKRDARLYAGPWPVVAHPPCARWGQLAPLVQAVYGYVIGDDGGCFAAALEAVRMYGGVLEHPAYSRAWSAFDLPRPQAKAGWTRSLIDAGASCYIEQGVFGCPARKPTWLYAYGVELPALPWRQTTTSPDDPGWWIDSRRDVGKRLGKRRMRDARASRTPEAFRDVLLAMARTATREAAAA